MAKKTEAGEEPAATAPAPKGARKSVRLTHFCNKAECAGAPGDVIDVAAADADWLAKVGGGYEVDADGEPVVNEEAAADA